jgi:hypothetical protein
MEIQVSKLTEYVILVHSLIRLHLYLILPTTYKEQAHTATFLMITY